MSQPHTLKESDLVAFSDAAAGHDGVLSDPTGALVIKPCTPAEIAFYTTAATSHPAFAAFMPTYMGTLQLSTPEQAAALSTSAAATLSPSDPGPAHGKKLSTEQAIVLENAASGFTRPNILDVKLGARLWDEAAPAAKRARLDKVAAESTSGSLGFRIAGMRVWRAERGEFEVFDKMYGRRFGEGDVKEGFREFFGFGEGRLSRGRESVVEYCCEQVRTMEEVLRKEESRMYSASILFVYEGDEEALESAIERNVKAADEPLEADEGEEEELPKICAVKLIDFAHASFTEGQGPDENALQGITSTKRILEELSKELT